MADNNNNNNGNPIVNPNQNTNSGANLATVLAQLNTTLQNMQNRSNNNSNDNLSPEVKRVLTLLERDSKELNASLSNIERNNKKQEKDNLKSLNDIRKSATLGNTDYQKFLDKFKDQIAKYEELVKKQTELKTKQESAEKEKNSLASQIRGLDEAIRNAQSEDEKEKLRDRLTELTTKLDAAKDAFNEASEELQHTNNQLNQNDMKGISQAATNIANHTQTTSEATRQLNKDSNANSKAERKTLNDLGVHLSDVFEGGLFNLGNSLGGTLDKIRNNALQNLSNRGPLGIIISSALSTVNSGIDYLNKNLVQGVEDLQNSFASTGIEISQAILLDKDEVAKMYGGWADELRESGFNVALTATDMANIANDIAKAGITDPDLMKAYAQAAMISKTELGASAIDFSDKESLEFINNLILQEINSGRSKNEAIDAILGPENGTIQQFTRMATSATDKYTGLAYSMGALQDDYTTYLKTRALYGDTAANSRLASDLAVQGAFTSIGAGDIGNTLIEKFKNTLSSGMTPEDLLSGLSNTWDSDTLIRLMQSGNTTEAYINMLEQMKSIGVEDSGSKYLMQQIFGTNPEDVQAVEAVFGSLDELIAILRKSSQKIATDTQSLDERDATIKAGKTVTTEQRLKNESTNYITDQWVYAELSHLPEAYKGLETGIELAGKGVETAISVAADLLVGSLQFTNLLGGVGGAGGGLGGLGSLSAVITAGIAGWEIGTAIDKKFNWSGKLSNALVGSVETTEEAADTLAEIKDRNAEENAKLQETLSTHLSNTVAKLDNIANNVKNVTEYTKDIATATTESKDARQAYISQLRTFADAGRLSLSNSEGAAEVLGMSSEELQSTIANTSGGFQELAKSFSDEELKQLVDAGYVTGIDRDTSSAINQAKSTYTKSVNKIIAETVDEPLQGMISDNVISDSEWGDLHKIISVAANEAEQAEEGVGQDVMKIEGHIRQRYDRYQALQELKRILLDFQALTASDRLEQYGTTSVANLKQQIISMSAEELASWAAKHGSSMIRPENFTGVNPYIDAKSDMISENALSPTGEQTWYTVFQPDNVTPLAVGLNYVPYNGFPAILHKGERVVTAADARLESLLEDVRYGLEANNNLYSNDDNIELLDTTNNSIVDGFDTTNKNQTTIIEALSVIISALQSNNTINYNNPFEIIKNDFIAQRQSNAAATSSVH